jgi:chromate reductase, NAD(P)H dehydrogenase (quinone)
VVALAGSLRRGSYNRLLLVAAAELAPPSLVVVPFDELGALPIFDEDHERDLPPPVDRMRRAVIVADGILIATPEYNQSIPGGLKNALDWLSRFDGVLAGKPAAVIGATVGRWGTRLAQRTVREVLHATESLVMPSPALNVSGAARMFDPDGRLTDPPTRETLIAVLVDFAAWIRATRRRCEAHSS